MTASTIPLRAAREYLGMWLMLGGGLLLGTIGVFIEEAGQHPLTTVWFRCCFGLLALTVWGAATGRLHELRMKWRDGLLALLAGSLVVINWALFFSAISRTSIGVATVVFHVQPLWVLALGAWWLKERVSPGQVAAAMAALVGLALASGVLDAQGGKATIDASYMAGVLMCLGGSFGYAVTTLIAQAARGVSPFALAWLQCALGTVALVWWPAWHGWPHELGTWAWLIALGVVHTGLAYVILYAGMARLSTGRIAVMQFVYPAAAVMVDWAVYGRALSLLQWGGVVLMVMALVTVERQKRGVKPGARADAQVTQR